MNDSQMSKRATGKKQEWDKTAFPLYLIQT